MHADLSVPYLLRRARGCLLLHPPTIIFSAICEREILFAETRIDFAMPCNNANFLMVTQKVTAHQLEQIKSAQKLQSVQKKYHDNIYIPIF